MLWALFSTLKHPTSIQASQNTTRPSLFTVLTFHSQCLNVPCWTPKVNIYRLNITSKTQKQNHPIAQRWEHHLHSADTRCCLPVPLTQAITSTYWPPSEFLLSATDGSPVQYGPVEYTAHGLWITATLRHRGGGLVKPLASLGYHYVMLETGTYEKTHQR